MRPNFAPQCDRPAAFASIDPSTATGKLHFTVIGALAEFERSNISECTLLAMIARAEKPLSIGELIGARRG